MLDDGSVRLPSNEYWGKRSGAIGRMSTDPSGARMPLFPGRKGSNAHDEHQGPCGYKTRWNPGRAARRSFGKHGLARAKVRP